MTPVNTYPPLDGCAGLLSPLQLHEDVESFFIKFCDTLHNQLVLTNKFEKLYVSEEN